MAATGESRLIRCPSCGTTNRVDLSRIHGAAHPVCGRCRTPLPLREPADVVELTDANFAAEAERAPIPVLIDFWAPWCGPCRFVSPIVEEVAADFAGRVKVGKLNVDDNPVTAERFAVRSIPTLVVLREGREVDRIVGAAPKLEIARRLQRTL
jgi:thioredoxin 2